MRDWNLVSSQPVTLTIAADARIIPFDLDDDQVWELNLGSSEPPAISLQTTFGLRARSCRIFPRFTYEGQTINNPKEFYRPITIHHYFANYIDLSFKPFNPINVRLEYWVPDPRSITCRIKVINTSGENCRIQIEWAEILIPSEDGHRMTSMEIEHAAVLAGQSSDLSPVLFLGGGAEHGKSPYPSLGLSFNLPPHQHQVLQWVHSVFSINTESHEHNKIIMSKNWDTEISRISRQNSQRLEISTGDKDWDTAIYLSQTIADQLIIKTMGENQPLLYVKSRKPDQPAYLNEDFANIGRRRRNNPALDTFYLSNFLLPAFTEYYRSLLSNLLPGQSSKHNTESDAFSHEQQNQLLDTPLLSSMVWEYYQYSGNKTFLIQIFPRLILAFDRWFTEAHDRDKDLVPEWDQPVQTGFNENPLFSFLGDLSIGMDISYMECPDLSAYLYNECQALSSIAIEIDETALGMHLQEISTALKTMIETTWDDTQACYFYRDRDSHISCFSQILGTRLGSGVIEVNQEFNRPCRPLISLITQSEEKKQVQIYFQGMIPGGIHRVEHIEPPQIHWQLNSGYITSNYTYTRLEQIEITGLSSGDEIIVRSSGAIGEDISMLLPLWAGISNPDQAKVLMNLTIMNKKKFLSTYGLKSFISLQQASEVPSELASVRPFWQNFIARGLLRYGERKKAAELFSRMIKAIVNSISQDMTLHQYYDSETGHPEGKNNLLDCLVPVGLFLEILGIKIYSPDKIKIIGGNPFPWPVTVKYRGLTVVHQEKKTLIIFSDGRNMTIDNQQPKIINLGIAGSA